MNSKRWAVNLLLTLVVIVASFALGSPARASVPDWDMVAMPSAAQVQQIESANVAVNGNGWAFRPAAKVAALPESPQAALLRSQSQCTSLGFFFCTWKDTGYAGLMWAWSQNTINGWYNYSLSLGFSPAPGGINNTGSSWMNLTTFNVRIFDDVHCNAVTGTSRWFRDMTPGQSAVGAGSDWNDRVSGIARIIRTDIDC